MSTILDTLITDRTQEDVDRAAYLESLWADLEDRLIWTGTPEELAEWQTNVPGEYRRSDLNRVEGAVAYLAGVMIALPEELRAYARKLGVEWHEFYDVPYGLETLRLATKTDWGMGDIPTTPDSARYLGNIAALCAGLQCGAAGLPDTLDKLFYRDANAIEACLKRTGAAFAALERDTMERLTKTAEAWAQSGEIFAEEMIS